MCVNIEKLRRGEESCVLIRSVGCVMLRMTHTAEFQNIYWDLWGSLSTKLGSRCGSLL